MNRLQEMVAPCVESGYLLCLLPKSDKQQLEAVIPPQLRRGVRISRLCATADAGKGRCNALGYIAALRSFCAYRRSAQAQNIRQRGATPDGGRRSIVPSSFSMTTMVSPSADFFMLSTVPPVPHIRVGPAVFVLPAGTR